MNIKAFFSKNWLHFAVIALMLLIAVIYFQPQLQGYGIKQHDVEQFKGMSHETNRYRENTGEEPLWTNALFGGMPTMQISMDYPGNFIKTIYVQYYKIFPGPIGFLLLHLIGFYLLSLFLKINPLIGLFGAIAFSFASYEIVILQAGHITKSLATAFMAPALGAFIYAYRSNWKWGIALLALFMTLELAVNHVQVTYYFLFVLLFLGIYFLFDAIKEKQLKPFFLTTAGVIGAFILAFAINIGNIALTSDYAKNTIRGGNDVTLNPDGTPALNQSEGLDKDYITNWSYGMGETFTLISPNVKGGGSFAIGGSQFQDILDNSDFSSAEKNELQNYPAYWGEQPMTSGPVYVGAVAFLLAFLGLIFVKSKIKWALFAATVLAIMLSWGKNFMGLTDFFIDYVPGYNKFRTVTIILVLVELCIPLLGMLFLDLLMKEREQFKAKKKLVLIAVGSFVFVLFLIKVIGLGDSYSSEGDQKQLSGIETNIRKQITGMDPQALLTQYNLDVNNPAQLDEFIAQQAEPYYKNFDKLKILRSDIFNASMTRTILFVLFGGAFLMLFFYTSISGSILVIGIVLLTMMDSIPVAYAYLGAQEEGNKLKYWEDAGIANYPIAANSADAQILENEISLAPNLKAIIDKAESEGTKKAMELGYTGTAKRNLIESYRFSALNFNTNYRVAEMNNLWSSTRASYFHKSIGGYHGAKLRNINNLFDFHLSKMNNKVYDMLNVKYFIQSDEKGDVASPNPTALGNAWLVKTIETYPTPNDEIRALGNQFAIENKGTGTFLVNYAPQQKATIYGGEKIQYVLTGKDTLNIPLSNGLTEGVEALFVMDVNGKTNLVPAATMQMDTAKSFTSLVSMKVINEFKPAEEAVLLDSEAKKLGAKKYSGVGSISLKSYAPNKITYAADLKGKQLAVFSEIYYADGWKAFVDGKEMPILKVDYLLRGLELTSGKHSIEFVFDLPKFHKANTVAGIGSFLLLGGIVLLIFLDWKAKKNAKQA